MRDLSILPAFLAPSWKDTLPAMCYSPLNCTGQDEILTSSGSNTWPANVHRAQWRGCAVASALHRTGRLLQNIWHRWPSPKEVAQTFVGQAESKPQNRFNGTPIPNSISTCSSVPGWTVHSSHKHLHVCSSMANTTFNSCSQGDKVCTAVYVVSLISTTMCCILVPLCFSPQLTWISGYRALLTLDPRLLRYAVLVFFETQTHTSTLFSELLTAISGKRIVFLAWTLTQPLGLVVWGHHYKVPLYSLTEAQSCGVCHWTDSYL